mmetsp:Transcript_4666/g.13198  ORF Transcript_4666/g.13198 Transcript_4666/m.13198 type:complete len:272 (-) Transcript_4666:320-1135(-)
MCIALIGVGITDVTRQNNCRVLLLECCKVQFLGSPNMTTPRLRRIGSSHIVSIKYHIPIWGESLWRREMIRVYTRNTCMYQRRSSLTAIPPRNLLKPTQHIHQTCTKCMETHIFLLNAVLSKVPLSGIQVQDGPTRRIRGGQELPDPTGGQIHRLILHGPSEGHGQVGSLLAEHRDASLPVLGQLGGRRSGVVILGLEEHEGPAGTDLIGTPLDGPVVRLRGGRGQPWHLNKGLCDGHFCRKRSGGGGIIRPYNKAGARRRRRRRLERYED